MSFDENSLTSIKLAKEAALEILLHNAKDRFKTSSNRWLGYRNLHRTDDLSSRFLATGNEQLADALERTLVALPIIRRSTDISRRCARSSQPRSSDSTPLFLFGWLSTEYRGTSRSSSLSSREAQKDAYQSPMTGDVAQCHQRLAR